LHPALDALMALYNTENAHSNYFRQKFKLITGDKHSHQDQRDALVRDA
jgi:hypothetical protein